MELRILIGGESPRWSLDLGSPATSVADAR
jgi:hypothetical protein